MKKLLCCACLLLFINLITKAQDKQFMVYFDFNQSRIPDSSMLALIKYVAKNKISKVMIEGHCDSIGSKYYNDALSKDRAYQVKKLLTDNEVPADAIKTCIGYGKDRPLNANANEEDRQLNRRVVVHFESTPLTVIEKPVAKTIDKTTAPPKLAKQDFKAGNHVVLKQLSFAGGRHVLLPESVSILEDLCSILKEHPSMKIEIQGHVCCTSIEPDGFDVDTHTNNLSVNRAKTVFHYLNVECGIDVSRLSYKGFGGSQKITLDESTEALQQINRRVEVKILAE